jgi:hypothetical protein
MLLLSLVAFEKEERKRERQEEDRKTGSGQRDSANLKGNLMG